MAEHNIQTKLDQIIDELASIEHERWAHWQKYVHDLAQRNSDGSVTIPSDFVTKWERKITANFTDLTDSEKESDRDQVRRYLPTIKNALSNG